MRAAVTALAAIAGLAASASSQTSSRPVPTVRVGETVNGSLTRSDSLYPDSSYYKIYQFMAPARGVITIDLSSDEFNPVLILRGDALDGPIFNDNSGPGCSARISRPFPSRGPYRILVNASSDPKRQTGRFTLTISRGPKPVQPAGGNADCPAAQRLQLASDPPPPAHAIAVGQTLEGSLSRSDVLLTSDSTYAQAWTIEGRTGTTITIDLVSDAFDAYLFLRGPGISGGSDFQDDDAGGNCHARLTATFPQNGSYEIVVNSAEHYATGPFTLSVTSGSKPKSLSRCTRNSQ